MHVCRLLNFNLHEIVAICSRHDLDPILSRISIISRLKWLYNIPLEIQRVRTAWGRSNWRFHWIIKLRNQRWPHVRHDDESLLFRDDDGDCVNCVFSPRFHHFRPRAWVSLRLPPTLSTTAFWLLSLLTLIFLHTLERLVWTWHQFATFEIRLAVTKSEPGEIQKTRTFEKEVLTGNTTSGLKNIVTPKFRPRKGI